IGVAITIASVAVTTIATSVPGVISPLGGLPPTTANLAAHFGTSFSVVDNGGVDDTTLNKTNGTSTGNNSTTTSGVGINTTTTNNIHGALGNCLCTQNCVDAFLEGYTHYAQSV
ncbi:hypothetical protein HDU76_010338, partial [Blyttiomyces sp. JEL0837]